MLEVITGAANSGKTGEAYSVVRKAASDRRRCALVLPSAPDLEHARRELSKQAPLGLEIVRMDRLVETLWGLTGDGRTIISPQERQIALSSLARTSGLSPSFARLADACVRELCEQTGEAWRSQGASVPQAGEDLARLILEYARHLESHGRIELAEAAKSQIMSNQSQYDVIVFHRFSDFSASQVVFIQNCASTCDVYCTLCLHEGMVATEAAQLVLEQLIPDSVRALPVEDKWTTAEIGELSERLFGAPRRIEPQGAVLFSLADGELAQATRIAEEVVRALRDGAASSPDQIAVVFREPARHYLTLAQAFEDAGVEADFDIRIPFKNTPLGSALLDVLSFVRRGDRQSLLSFLRSSQSGLSREDVRTIEGEWRKRGANNASVLLGELGAYEGILASRLRELRRGQAAPLTQSVFEALAALSASSCGGNRSSLGEQRGRLAELDAMAHSAFVRLLSTMWKAEGIEVGFDDLIEMAMRLEVTPREVEHPGRVQVVPAARMRGRRFETVIIGGLNRGEFPVQTDERMAAGGALTGVMQSFGGKADAHDEDLFERALFYETVTRARKRVVFSAVAADDDGAAADLSPFFEAVFDHYRRDDGELPPHEHRGLSEAPSDDSFAGRRELLRFDAFAQRYLSQRAMAAAARSGKRRVGLTGEHVLSLDTVSPSSIELYLRCPYRWYYQHVLRASELEREFDPREEGELAHRLLARTYASLADQALTPLRPDRLQTALDMLDREYAACPSARQEQSAAEMIGRRRAKAWAARILTEDAFDPNGFRPAFFEFTIGTTDDPLILGALSLKGRVDRIDVDGQGRAIVIDYKRSADAEYGAKQLLKNGSVQVPLYMLAVSQRLQVEPVGGFYRGLSKSVRRGIARAGVLDDDLLTRGDAQEDDAFEQLLVDALALSEEAVVRMRQGDIEAAPRSSKACMSCPVAPLCGARA